MDGRSAGANFCRPKARALGCTSESHIWENVPKLNQKSDLLNLNIGLKFKVFYLQKW